MFKISRSKKKAGAVHLWVQVTLAGLLVRLAFSAAALSTTGTAPPPPTKPESSTFRMITTVKKSPDYKGKCLQDLEIVFGDYPIQAEFMVNVAS